MEEILLVITLLLLFGAILEIVLLPFIYDFRFNKKRKNAKKKKVIVDKKQNNEKIKILLSEKNIIEKINEIIDSLISNASSNYKILTIKDDKTEGYITPDMEKEMSDYIFQTVKNNMTEDIKDIISLIYVIDTEKKLDSLLLLRIKFYMINQIISNNIEK